MPDQPRRRLKRGVVVIAVVVVVLAAVGGVALVRSRQTERSVDALCEQLRAAQDLDQALTALDPATLKPQVEALQMAKAAAPSEIRASVATLADFVDGVTQHVDTAEGDRQSALADALEARQDEIDEVTAAGNAVQEWAQANCGLSLTGAGPPTTPTSAAPSDASP